MSVYSISQVRSGHSTSQVKSGHSTSQVRLFDLTGKVRSLDLTRNFDLLRKGHLVRSSRLHKFNQKAQFFLIRSPYDMKLIMRSVGEPNLFL